MTTPEGKIEKHLKKEVEASGGKVRKLKWIGKNGAPDRIIWWPALTRDGDPRMAFVELKAPGKKPTKIQSEEHKAMLADGFLVYVVDSIDAANAVIITVRDTNRLKGQIFKHAEPARAINSKDVPVSVTVTPKYDVKTPANLPKPDNSDLV